MLNSFKVAVGLLAFATVYVLLASCASHNQATVFVPDDWRKVDLRYLSFSVPPNLKPQPVQGIDSEVLAYNGDNLRVEVELGMYVDDLHSYNKQPNYSKEEITIDGKHAILCQFNYDDIPSSSAKDDKKNVMAAYFPDIDKGTSRLTFMVSYKDQTDLPTARTILSSIRFK